MLIRYKKHYNFLIKKYGEEIGMDKYRFFLRSTSLETYIIKFGEKEGKKKHGMKKKPGSSLKKMIEKHGEELGRVKYDSWVKKSRQTLENFIERYGETDGEKNYNKFKMKCVVKDDIKNDPTSKYNNRKHTTRIDYYLEKYDGDLYKAKIALSNRQKTSTLEKMIEKYGEEEGIKKYKDINRRKSITLKNFIKLYGEEEGNERWESYLKKKRFIGTEKYYIEKYGEEEGNEKYKELLKKKAFYSKTSKIANEFCSSLFDNLKSDIGKCYFGENEYMFFIHDENFKILKPDFYIKEYKIVVEFYGDYWHRNPNIYNDEISEQIRNRDKKRIEKIKQIDTNIVFIVWEKDYNNNKIKIIDDISSKIKKIIKKNGNS